jgi:hypothetical protein
MFEPLALIGSRPSHVMDQIVTTSLDHRQYPTMFDRPDLPGLVQSLSVEWFCGIVFGNIGFGFAEIAPGQRRQHSWLHLRKWPFPAIREAACPLADMRYSWHAIHRQVIRDTGHCRFRTGRNATTSWNATTTRETE